MAVDQPEALWLAPCEFMISRTDLMMKFDGLFVDASLALIGIPSIARAGTGETGLRVDIDAQRQVGNQAVASDPIDFEDSLPTQTACCPLIGDRGIREAIRHHDLALGHGRHNPFFNALRA